MLNINLKILYELLLLEHSVCSVWDKGYRYGFNGKEIDKGSEGMGGGGSTYDYGFRIYNPSLGKFLSVDPLFKSYPWFTPYQFAGNGPINAIDLDGLEQAIVTKYKINNKTRISIKFVNPNERVDHLAHGKLGFDYLDKINNPNNSSTVRMAELTLNSPEYLLYNYSNITYYVPNTNGAYTDCFGVKYEKKTGPLKDALGNHKSIPTKAADGSTHSAIFRTGVITIQNQLNIFYNNDRSKLKSSDLNSELNNITDIKAQLDEIGEKMRSDQSLTLNIVGFTDKDGSNESNQKLANKRIEGIKKYLTDKYQISESRYTTTNKGESISNQNEKKPEDRKVELTLVKNTVE